MTQNKQIKKQKKNVETHFAARIQFLASKCRAADCRLYAAAIFPEQQNRGRAT